MMIRQPLPRRWRIGLGIASVLLLLLGYAALAEKRQAERRAVQRSEAAQKLAAIDAQMSAAAQVAPGGAPDARQMRLASERAQWAAQYESPDAVDRSVPTWQMLWRDGLVRACTPQGSLKRKEVWLRVDAAASLGRLLAGLTAGIVLAVVLGLLMGCYSAIESFLLPPFAFLSKIPPTAMLAAFFVLVGTTFKMYVVMLVFGMVPTLAQTISASVRKDVPDELIFKAYTLGASQTELIWDVVLRQILPRVLDAARLAIGPALVLLVAAEWMVADQGFGYRLRLFYQRTDMTIVYVYCALLGLGGLLADYGLSWCRQRLCPWFGD
jgi:NitT/TauT family transport system permease protein